MIGLLSWLLAHVCVCMACPGCVGPTWATTPTQRLGAARGSLPHESLATPKQRMANDESRPALSPQAERTTASAKELKVFPRWAQATCDSLRLMKSAFQVRRAIQVWSSNWEAAFFEKGAHPQR